MFECFIVDPLFCSWVRRDSVELFLISISYFVKTTRLFCHCFTSGFQVFSSCPLFVKGHGRPVLFIINNTILSLLISFGLAQ